MAQLIFHYTALRPNTKCGEKRDLEENKKRKINTQSVFTQSPSYILLFVQLLLSVSFTKQFCCLLIAWCSGGCGNFARLRRISSSVELLLAMMIMMMSMMAMISMMAMVVRYKCVQFYCFTIYRHRYSNWIEWLLAVISGIRFIMPMKYSHKIFVPLECRSVHIIRRYRCASL